MSRVLPLLLFLVPAAAAWGGEPAPERFTLTAGDYLFGADTDLRLGLREVAGTRVDWERDLGIETSQRAFRLGGRWRIHGRHRLDLGFFRYSRVASKEVERTIVWGGAVFDVDAEVSARIAFTFARALYGYSLLNRGPWEGGLRVGVSWMEVGASLEGRARLDGGTLARIRRGEAASLPLPVAGAYLEWRPVPGLELEAGAYRFQARYGDYRGALTGLTVGIRWFPSRSVGVGVEHDTADLKVGVREQYTVDAEHRLSGLHLFLILRF